LPVFRHALMWLEENEDYRPDIIVHLRPTAPLRKIEHIDAGIELLLKNKSVDSVRSVCKSTQTPYKMWRIKNGYLVPLLDSGGGVGLFNQPRQNLPVVYWQNASVDVIKYDTIMKKNTMTGKYILPLIMEEKNSIDLDTELDFKITEQLIIQGGNNEKKDNI